MLCPAPLNNKKPKFLVLLLNPHIVPRKKCPLVSRNAHHLSILITLRCVHHTDQLLRLHQLSDLFVCRAKETCQNNLELTLPDQVNLVAMVPSATARLPATTIKGCNQDSWDIIKRSGSESAIGNSRNALGPHDMTADFFWVGRSLQITPYNKVLARKGALKPATWLVSVRATKEYSRELIDFPLIPVPYDFSEYLLSQGKQGAYPATVHTVAFLLICQCRGTQVPEEILHTHDLLLEALRCAHHPTERFEPERLSVWHQGLRHLNVGRGRGRNHLGGRILVFLITPRGCHDMGQGIHSLRYWPYVPTTPVSTQL